MTRGKWQKMGAGMVAVAVGVMVVFVVAVMVAVAVVVMVAVRVVVMVVFVFGVVFGVMVAVKPPKMSSSSRVFEKRGDPWVSAREGREKFGRILDLENVDRDGQNHRLSSSFWERKLQREAKDGKITLYTPKPDKELTYHDKKLRIIRRLKDKLK